MIYACDYCHYTFDAESLPDLSPDCHKEKINRRAGMKIIEASAVREATKQEQAWYEEYLRTKDFEDYRKNKLENLSGMTDDQYNWAMVMLFEKAEPKTTEARDFYNFYLRQRFSDPKRLLEYYLDIRRDFTRDITADRYNLKKEGKSEPLNIENYDDLGNSLPAEEFDVNFPALSVLYRFKLDEFRSFLHTPNLGDLKLLINDCYSYFVFNILTPFNKIYFYNIIRAY